MSEAAELMDTGEVLLAADYPDEDEFPTNHLRSGKLGTEHSVVEEIDWLLKLRTKNLATKKLADEPLMRPSGMASHTAAVKIVPTRGAKLRTGMRRGTLLITLLVLAVGALAG